MQASIYIITSIKGPAIRPHGRYLYLINVENQQGQIVSRTGYGTVKDVNENRLALRALVKAMRRLKPSDLKIYTNCNYLSNYFFMLPKWQQANWQIRGRDIKNLAAWVEISVRSEGKQVEFYPLDGSSYQKWMEHEIHKLETEIKQSWR